MQHWLCQKSPIKLNDMSIANNRNAPTVSVLLAYTKHTKYIYFQKLQFSVNVNIKENLPIIKFKGKNICVLSLEFYNILICNRVIR